MASYETHKTIKTTYVQDIPGPAIYIGRQQPFLGSADLVPTACTRCSRLQSCVEGLPLTEFTCLNHTEYAFVSSNTIKPHLRMTRYSTAFDIGASDVLITGVPIDGLVLVRALKLREVNAVSQEATNTSKSAAELATLLALVCNKLQLTTKLHEPTAPPLQFTAAWLIST